MDEAVLRIRIESGGEVPKPSPAGESFGLPVPPLPAPEVAPREVPVQPTIAEATPREVPIQPPIAPQEQIARTISEPANLVPESPQPEQIKDSRSIVGDMAREESPPIPINRPAENIAQPIQPREEAEKPIPEQTLSLKPLPKEIPELSPTSPFAGIYEKQTKEITGLMESIGELDKQIRFSITEEGQHMAGVMSSLGGHQKELISQNELIAKQERARFLQTEEGLSQAQKLLDLQNQIKEVDEEISRLTPEMAIPVETLSTADQYREKSQGIYDDLLKAREQLSFLQTDEGGNQLEQISQWQEEIDAINKTIAGMTPVAVEAFDTIGEKLEKEIISNRELLEVLKEEEDYYRSKAGKVQLQEQLALQKQVEDSKKRVQDLKTPTEKKEGGLFGDILSMGSKQGGLIGKISSTISDVLKQRIATGAIGETAIGAGAGAAGANAAGMGGTATALAGGIGAAMPVVGIAIGVAGAIVEAVKKMVDAIKSAVRAIGSFAVAVASPDANPATALEKAGGAAEKFGEKIFYFLPGLGIFSTAIGMATNILGQFMHTVDGLVERYGQFSPQIAQAQAMNEIKQVFGDIRRSQELGPQLVRYLQVQGEMQQKFEDIKVKILLQIMPIANRMMEIITEIVKFFENFDEKGLEMLAKFARAIPIFSLGADTLDQMAENLRIIRQEAEAAAAEEARLNDPLNVILGNVGVFA